MNYSVKGFITVLLGTSLLSGQLYADTYATTNTQSGAMQNETASTAFLSANQKKPGVTTLSNGLQYKIIEPGKGMSPTDDDTVVVDYRGTLPDGTEFDSSYKRGQPATFQVSAVIPGWTQALKMMKPGATWELYIPATLAYGDQGAPPVIGPNQALIFKVHLIKVTK